MLKAPATFPMQGADALVERDGRTVAVRILRAAGPDGLATVTGAGPGASGTFVVEAKDLIDPTPLSPAEEAELDQLHRQSIRDEAKWVSGRGKGTIAARARYAELSLRRINAQVFADLQRQQRRAA